MDTTLADAGRDFCFEAIIGLHIGRLTMPKIRLLLIEDNRILRDGITAMINGHRDVVVVAVSDGKHDTLSKAQKVKPDVVLMDLSLDSQISLDVLQSIKEEFPAIKIIGMGLAPAQADIM